VTLLGFLDWKSGGLVGHDIMLEESTQCIASAFRNAIINIRLSEPEPIKKITIQFDPRPKQDFEPKVETSIVARPIFKSACERYKWHMQNGCIYPEDRTWLANYIKSDEYKEIYS